MIGVSLGGRSQCGWWEWVTENTVVGRVSVGGGSLCGWWESLWVAGVTPAGGETG